jgi:3-oxoacyl-[acyl-carrier-protein] synthase III
LAVLAGIDLVGQEPTSLVPSVACLLQGHIGINAEGETFFLAFDAVF